MVSVYGSDRLTYRLPLPWCLGCCCPTLVNWLSFNRDVYVAGQATQQCSIYLHPAGFFHPTFHPTESSLTLCEVSSCMALTPQGL